MIQNDLMKEWFKELPQEKPSPDFNVSVMKRVMTEWSLNPNKYQPMISKKGWWTIALFAFVLTSFLFMLHPAMTTGTASTVPSSTIFGYDLLKVFEPVTHILGRLNNVSPAVAVGILAIIALWFFDQLFVRALKR